MQQNKEGTHEFSSSQKISCAKGACIQIVLIFNHLLLQ